MRKTIKKIFPQVSTVAGYYYSGKRWMRGVRLSMLSRESTFRGIYRANKWRDSESRSGPGSNLSETNIIRQKIPELIRDLEIRSVLDAPCGDFFWIKDLGLDVDSYTGVDIVDELIEENIRKFSRPGREFLQLDICDGDVLASDLIICRDALVHLSFADIACALRNFRRSGSTYLLTTIFPDLDHNTDITTGMWRPLNLFAKPFNFPPPLKLIEEQSALARVEYGKKCLGLWSIAQLPDIEI